MHMRMRVRFRTIVYANILKSQNSTGGFQSLRSFHTEQARERCSNATNGQIRTLYILMMHSHCRVSTRAKSIATVIARIGHVSNLTTHI